MGGRLVAITTSSAALQITMHPLTIKKKMVGFLKQALMA